MIGDLLSNMALAQKEDIEQLQKSIQAGSIPAYIGVPLLQQKVNQSKQAAALLAGKQQQGKPPIGQEVMQEAAQLTRPQMPMAAPQQMAQAAPQQGIDAAQSNLPAQGFAGGGIIAFDGGGTANSDDVVYDDGDSQLQQNYQPVSMLSGAMEGVNKQVPGLPDWITKPGGISWWGGKDETPEVKPTPVPVPEPKKPGIVIHDDKSKKPASPSTKLEELTGAQPDAGITGLQKKQDTMLSDLKSLILGDKEDENKQLKINALLAALSGGFKMMGGASPFASVNIGAGGEEFAKGLAGAVQQQQANKQRQVGQLVALGLKGAELDTELKKLGITKEYYDAHAKLFGAQSDYYRGRAAGVGSSTGKGSVSSAVVQQELDRLEGFKSNPKTAPFFSKLPPEVQQGLTKYPPGSQSYNNALNVFTQYANQYTQNRLETMRGYGAKAVASPYGMPE